MEREKESMSSVLNRKKKKNAVSQKRMNVINDAAKRVKNTESLIEESYYNLRLIAYQILHDKFGFGQKRIIKVETTIDEYMIQSTNEGVTEKMFDYLNNKCCIDVKLEANKTPFRERFALTSRKIHADSIQSAGEYLLASICNYFSLLGVCLKKEFKFSTRQIKEVYEWMRYYINTLSRYKQFELSIKDIALCLMEECKYCDARFM